MLVQLYRDAFNSRRRIGSIYYLGKNAKQKMLHKTHNNAALTKATKVLQINIICKQEI